ncbi:putative F420-dependent oxidoreductase [Gordonia hirsuta DSM 44140 = NBRC 16056]|uniref:Putative F420-dependent oxidoreductase n=1 Tax=Gordonia hirsuta DSM 44140 = NBRC 16056 TaxID=1121927 RepID=L7LCU6_9ACTN|nr:putative F420-dependent oxidoreductase [Gordonia hirsuta DSM 44140 = NBRC 16056]
MKLGLQLGYWGAEPLAGAPELIAAAEDCGFDTVFTAESWGSDAYTPLAWWGADTSRIRLGTAVAQLSARPPTSLAMAALTLDHLSGGRHIIGLGVSGPQVVEGWYGQPFARPLARTREYVRIVRDVLARRGPVTSDGPHYGLPLPGGTGLGRALTSITHPRRPDTPIWLGAEGPRNVAQTAEIADGWLAVFFSPRMAGRYDEWLDEGFARPGARRSRADFEIAANAACVITDDVAAALDRYRPSTALYVGGMGAREKNFHADLYRRMGYGQVVDDVTRLFLSGRKAEAVAAVPDEMVRETMLVGTADQVRAQLAEWAAAGVTLLMVTARDVATVRALAALTGGAAGSGGRRQIRVPGCRRGAVCRGEGLGQSLGGFGEAVFGDRFAPAQPAQGQSGQTVGALVERQAQVPRGPGETQQAGIGLDRIAQITDLAGNAVPGEVDVVRAIVAPPPSVQNGKGRSAVGQNVQSLIQVVFDRGVDGPQLGQQRQAAADARGLLASAEPEAARGGEPAVSGESADGRAVGGDHQRIGRPRPMADLPDQAAFEIVERGPVGAFGPGDPQPRQMRLDTGRMPITQPRTGNAGGHPQGDRRIDVAADVHQRIQQDRAGERGPPRALPDPVAAHRSVAETVGTVGSQGDVQLACGQCRGHDDAGGERSCNGNGCHGSSCGSASVGNVNLGHGYDIAACRRCRPCGGATRR